MLFWMLLHSCGQTGMEQAPPSSAEQPQASPRLLSLCRGLRRLALDALGCMWPLCGPRGLPLHGSAFFPWCPQLTGSPRKWGSDKMTPTVPFVGWPLTDRKLT